MQDFSGAMEDCSEVLGAEAANCKALYRRAKAAFALCSYKQCLDDASRILQLEPGNAAAMQLQKEAQQRRAQRSDELKAQGNEAMAAGDAQLAIELYSRAIEADDGNFAALNNRSLAFMKRAAFALAEQDATSVIERCASRNLVQKAWLRRAEARFQSSAGERARLELALRDVDALQDGDAQPAAMLLRRKIEAALRIADKSRSVETRSAVASASASAATSAKDVAAEDVKLAPSPSPSPSKPEPKLKPKLAVEEKAQLALKKVKLVVPPEPPRTLYE